MLLDKIKTSQIILVAFLMSYVSQFSIIFRWWRVRTCRPWVWETGWNYQDFPSRNGCKSTEGSIYHIYYTFLNKLTCRCCSCIGLTTVKWHLKQPQYKSNLIYMVGYNMAYANKLLLYRKEKNMRTYWCITFVSFNYANTIVEMIFRSQDDLDGALSDVRKANRASVEEVKNYYMQYTAVKNIQSNFR